MDKRNELLMKAKALAALEARVDVFVGWHGLWNAECDGKVLSFGNETPVAALAVAADALGIAPDPFTLSDGVRLTALEREAVQDAIKQYEVFVKESKFFREEHKATLAGLQSLLSRLTGGA